VRLPTRRLIVAVLLTVLAASTASAQRHEARRSNGNFMFGPQLGFATNSLRFFIGGQFSKPLADQFDLYPSFDIFTPPSSVRVWGINAEGRYWPKLGKASAGLYVGGGLSVTNLYIPTVSGVIRRKFLGTTASTTDWGAGLLGGWDFKAVSWRPFVQVHAVFGKAERVEFAGGVNLGF